MIQRRSARSGKAMIAIASTRSNAAVSSVCRLQREALNCATIEQQRRRIECTLEVDSSDSRSQFVRSDAAQPLFFCSCRYVVSELLQVPSAAAHRAESAAFAPTTNRTTALSSGSVSGQRGRLNAQSHPIDRPASTASCADHIARSTHRIIRFLASTANANRINSTTTAKQSRLSNSQITHRPCSGHN